MSKIIYSDPGYERLTTDEINEARQSLQTMLEAWNALKLNSITTKSELYDLLLIPEAMYSEGLLIARSKSSDTNAPAPQSNPPDPHHFYNTARAAKEAAYTGREYGIFSIEKGKVAIIKEAANTYIFNRTITADTPEQEAFAKDIENFTKTFNVINAKLGGRLLDVPAFRNAWGQILAVPPEGYSDTSLYPASFKTDKLRELIQLT